MSKGVVTQQGLKYTLTDEIYEEVIKKDNGSNRIWNQVNNMIEAKEVLPSFLSIVVFVVVSLVSQLDWFWTPILSLGGYLIGVLLSKSLQVLVILEPILTIYKALTKFFIQYIVVILLSEFILRNWVAAPIYIVGVIILALCTKGSYSSNQMLNDQIALMMVLKKDK